MERQENARGREISEQRRSGASGLHGKKRKDRRNVKRIAIQRSKDD